MARKSYSDETKAAVMAALLEGQSVTAAAEQYNVPRGTVAGWSSKLSTSGVSSVSNEKRQEIGDLLVEVLRENLKTLAFISKAVRNEAWILEQDAAAIATLFGVKNDKAVRMVEAFGESDE